MATKATTLIEAMASFDPAPIEFEAGASPTFYVEREDEPLELMRVRLLKGTGRGQKFLLAGHRGSGKSTELNRLCVVQSIRERYEIVKFSVKDVLDVTDISHIDLLFSLVARSYRQLADGPSPIALSDQTLKLLDGWRSKVTEKVQTAGREADVEARAGGGIRGLLGSFFAEFGGRLLLEHGTRGTTRQVIEPRLSEFLETLDQFFIEAEVALDSRGRQLLLIVEDLDKIPDIERALALFHRTGVYLTRPRCRIIYTVPIAFHYSKAFQQVAAMFGQQVFLSNVRLASRDPEGGAYLPGRQTMRWFVTRRMDECLIEDDALDEAIAAGGGVFQQMQRIMEDACTRAVARDLPTITVEEIRDAVAELRAELERSIGIEDVGILKRVADTREAVTDDATLRLLHSLHLIEYRNRERWCAVNPLLDPTLERWSERNLELQ